MVNELHKNIIQRLPAAIVLAIFIFGILYLQNIFVILALLMGIGILLIKEWLTLSGTKIDLKQIIFFVTLIVLSVNFADKFIDLFLALTAIFWITYSFYLMSNQTLSFISFHNNYLGIFLILSFLLAFIHLLIFSEFVGINKFFVLFVILFNTVLADVGAYLVGSSIGKTPLFPEISPNKTMEGLLG